MNKKQIIMTQDFINKVEESFSTLHKSNDKFYIFEELVNDALNNDSEKDQVIETIHKILNLFNTSDTETQEVLYNSEISDVIKMIS